MDWPEKWLDAATGRVRHVPLEWLAFGERPEVVTRGGLASVSRHGVPTTYAVLVDGREVPFKLIEGPGPGKHRPVMVALHGMGVTPATYQGIMPAVLKTHDVLVVDYNSFGGSGWPAGGVSLRMMAAAVWRVVDAVGLERVGMMGSSLGGGLALIATSMQPRRVTEMVLMNPAAYPQPLPKMYKMMRVPMVGDMLMRIASAEKLVGGVAYVGYSVPERMPAELRWAYERNLSGVANRLKLMDVMRALPADERDMQEQLRRTQGMPHRALVLWGMMERLLPAEGGRWLKRDLPGCELVEYGDLAHLPQEEDPVRVGAEIGRFLAVNAGK